MWNPLNLRVISAENKPSNSVFVPDIAAIPHPNIYNFNLAVTTFELSPNAQIYYDQLNLKALAKKASRSARDPCKFIVFSIRGSQFAQFEQTLAERFPDHAFRPDFIASMKEVAARKRELIGQGTELIGNIHIGGTQSGMHTDLAYWRTVYQPNKKKNPSNTTIIADDAVPNRELDTENMETNSMWVMPLNGFTIMAGRRHGTPRWHSIPPIGPSEPARFTLVGDNPGYYPG